MKIPEGLQLPDRYDSNPRELYSIKLQRSLYGLKQAGRMWYNRLTKYLLKQGYNNDPICPCVFIKRYQSQFVIIIVYVDDLNIIIIEGPEVPYLSAIGALMYLASHTRHDISFAVNLLARYSSSPKRRHWTGIKQIF